MSKAPERSVVGRTKRLMGMAAKVASHEVAERISARFQKASETGRSVARRVEQARIVADNLAQLRGAAMKAGQFLSIDASDFLPPEAAQMLARLQDKAEAVPFSTIRQVLFEDLGEEGLGKLQNLGETAAAAASIGQVHRASVEGRPVAVKVQFPGIADSIQSDLSVLETFVQGWLRISGRRMNTEATFAELQRVLEQEADYEHELRMLQLYQSRLEDPRFAVPQAYPALCGPRVLVMGWLHGKSFAEWMASSPSQAQRLHLARAMLDLYCLEFFSWGVVQTDPNPGNFLILDDGRLGLLDFGATLEYPSKFRRRYVELLQIMESGKDGDILEAGIEFGLIDRRESKQTLDLFTDMVKAATAPFAPESQPFTFRDERYHQRARETVFEMLSAIKYSTPPRELIFLHRKLGGLFNLLKRLDVTLDLAPYWEKMVAGEPTLETAPSSRVA